MATKGGSRPGSGRPKGSPNKATAIKERAIADSGLTPLDYMLSVLRNSDDDAKRFEAAKAAAPYCHPRLTTVDAKIDGEMQIAGRLVWEWPKT